MACSIKGYDRTLIIHEQKCTYYSNRLEAGSSKVQHQRSAGLQLSNIKLYMSRQSCYIGIGEFSEAIKHIAYPLQKLKIDHTNTVQT